MARFQALDGSATVARTEPLPRLFGEPGDSVHPDIAPAGFEATWTGFLDVPEDGAYVFTLEPSSLSNVRLSLNKREIPLGTAIDLEYGQAPFELRGLHLQGTPTAELFWKGARFAKERIPPWAFRHLRAIEEAAALEEGELLDRGAVLAEAFGCFRCHEGPEGWVSSLARGLDLNLLLPGPRLDRMGNRLRRAWVEAWLRDPHSLRPGTSMPALFGKGSADEEAIQTIAAYLTRGQGNTPSETRPLGDAKRGREIYRALACGACHESVKALLLDGLAKKWTVAGLTTFLKRPLEEREQGRMPDFALSDEEAEALSAYLLTREGAGEVPLSPWPQGEPAHQDPMDEIGVDRTDNILLFHLNEGAGELEDSSGKGNHGHAVGKVFYGRPGRLQSALGFERPEAEANKEPGYVTVSTAGAFDFNKDFTWSAWVHTTGDGTILACAPSAGKWARGGKSLFVRDGKLAFDVGWVGVLESSERVSDGRWHHVAVTNSSRDGGQKGSTRLYVDGYLAGARDDWKVGAFPEDGLVLKIGFTSVDFPRPSAFQGRVDEVAVWSRALEPLEIEALWDQLPLTRPLRAKALELLVRRGCASCHDHRAMKSWGAIRRPGGAPLIEGATRPLQGPPLKDLAPERLTRGCLSERMVERGAAPDFRLSREHRLALAKYVSSLRSRSSPSMAEALRIEMELLGCRACHRSEGDGGEALRALLGGSEAARWKSPPDLTGVADRIDARALKEYLHRGARDHPLRPWVAARMPGFGDRGARLARWLSLRDGAGKAEPSAQGRDRESLPALPPGHLELGQFIAGRKGLACIHCHTLNQNGASGADETTRGPDLGLVARHLRKDYFARFLQGPSRVFPEIKMPQALSANGAMLLPAVKDFPPALPLDALWNYLSLGPKAPFPAESAEVLALPKVARPLVQRGLVHAGKEEFPRGIALGFPLGTVLFDAESLGPAAVWFGSFLTPVEVDYFGLSWRASAELTLLPERSQPLEFQLEEGAPWQAPLGAGDGDSASGSRFDGYAIGRSSVTLRYRLRVGQGAEGRPLPVAETLRAVHRGGWSGFRRELSIGGLPGGARVLTRSTAGAERLGGTTFFALRSGEGTWLSRFEAGAGTSGKVENGGFCVSSSAEGGGQLPTNPLLLSIERWFHPGHRPALTDEEMAQLVLPQEGTSRGEEGAPKPRERDPAPRSIEPVEEPFSYRLETIAPPGSGWRPSGTAFLPDGYVYAADMPAGRIYRVRIPPTSIPRSMDWSLFAAGLNHPTGMKAVDSRLFVSQRPEVTELIDRNGDGTADEYRSVFGPWSLGIGFHEYAFGLAADREKKLYVALNTGYFWSYGGPTNRGRYRGSIVRGTLDGPSEEVAKGCRVPNGITEGPDGEVFFCDNQGDWIQVCKVAHVQSGRFYGHPEREGDFLPKGDHPDGRAACWLPYEHCKSAAGLCFDSTGGRFGPFAGQMLVGDVGYGNNTGILRVALEKVDGEYQGACFRFIDGEPHGPEHMSFGPDGRLYISCLTSGLVRVRFGGRVPMAIHSLRIRPGGEGFIVRFTKPLSRAAEPSARTIRARRWHYRYSIEYGSPKIDEREVPIEKAVISPDRKELTLTLPVESHPNGRVYYFHLGKLLAEDGEALAQPEAWYTVERVPVAGKE
jgi:mono/diheme cytochrome c family protein/glucose/arabinose dehydrogenase